MQSIVNDIRFALRSLMAAPGFTLTSTLTLALGIGAVTAIFSLVDGVLLRPLPYASPERLAVVWGRWDGLEDTQRAPVSARTVVEMREQVDALGSVVGMWSQPATLSGDGEPEEITLARVSTDFLGTLGIAPILGRHFEPGDDTTAVILSHGLWQQRYGGDPEILGSSIQVLDQGAVVVGVLPPGPRFRMPSWSGPPISDIAVWQNMLESWIDPTNPDDSFRYIRLYARLADDASTATAQAQLDALAARQREANAEKADGGFHLDVKPFHGELVGGVRAMIVALAGAVALVLLVACANVANLLLFRGQARGHEMAVRAALGSGRGRLARQLLTEATVLAVLGTAAGIVVAVLLIAALPALAPGELPGAENVGLDGRALVFAALTAAVAATLFGLQPALRLSAQSPADALRSGRHSGLAGRRLRRGLVVGEVAISLILLVCAGLLLRNFAALQNIRPGFDADGTLTFAARLTADQANELQERIGGLPGVDSVGATRHLPLTGAQLTMLYGTRESESRSQPRTLGDQRFVTPDYFAAMGTRLIDGAVFAADPAVPGVVVDANLASDAWGDADPVGQEILMPVLGNPDEFVWAPVVGVVEHIRHNDVHADSRPAAYQLLVSNNAARLRFVVRSGGDPYALVEPVKDALRGVAAEVPMTSVASLADTVAETLASARFAFFLLGAFAATAVVLAAVGLVGVVSQSVNQRVYEVGLRRALGGSRAQVGRLVIGEGLRLAAFGVVIGIGGAALGARALGDVLVAVSAFDPLTYLVLAAALTTLAGVACYLPARRAMAIEPTEALRRT